MGDPYYQHTLIPYETLLVDTGLPPGQFLLYSFMLASLRGKWGDLFHEPPKSSHLQPLHVTGSGEHLVRWFADSLRIQTAVPLTALRQRWEAELTHPCTDKQWRVHWRPSACSTKHLHQLIQIYTIHRAYLTPAKINCIYLRSDAACPVAFNMTQIYFTCSGPVQICRSTVMWSHLTSLLVRMPGYTHMHTGPVSGE